MYVITGATGNTGKIIASTLLEAGKEVRIIARNTEKAKELTEKGAFMGMGASENVADKMNEFLVRVNAGEIFVSKRNESNTTPTTIEEFSHTFSFVYNM